MIFDPIRNPSDALAEEQGYRFDEAAGLRACQFVEKFCRQSKGRWAGQPIELIEWQRTLLMLAFGWRRPDGRRRFRTVHVEVPKKNGKSTLLSAVSLYLGIADGEAAAEVYLNAVNRKQADIIFEEACRMVEASPQLSRRLAISRYNGTITDPTSYGKIQKNSADAPSADGVNGSGIIFDEVHRFPNRRLWEVFDQAGISREQPIRFAITTAGEDAEGIWFEEREFSEKIESGAILNTTHLGMVFRARTEGDPGGPDDIDDPATWCKANPSMGYTMTLEDFGLDLRKARDKGGSEWANFLRLRLGIIIRAEGKFVDMTAWGDCSAAAEPDPDDPCWMGLDLSARDDLTALAILTRAPDGSFDVQWRFWLPEGIIVDLENRHGQPYRLWAERGLIELTPGNTIDEAYIEAAIVEEASGRNLLGLLIDEWQARRLATDLKNDRGLPVEFIRQGYRSLSEPTKALRDWIVGRKIRHGGHPIARWHASNAIATQDPAGNIKLDKGKSKNRKIDGLAALVNATAGVIDSPPAGPSVYETHGLISI